MKPALLAAILLVLVDVGLLAGPGDVLWDHPFQIEGGYDSWGQKLIVSGGRVFMAGNAVRLDQISSGSHMDGVLAAFDPATGQTLWSTAIGVNYPVFDRLIGLGMSSQYLFVAGFSENTDDGLPTRTFLRKHNPVTGVASWQKTIGGVASGFTCIASSLTMIEGKVFVSGSTRSWDGNNANTGAFTRAYSSTNGAVLWEAKVPAISVIGTSVADGNRVFVSITSGVYPNEVSTIRAYNAANGVKIWEKPIDPGKNVRVMKAGGNQIFLAGYGTRTNETDFFVQSQRADTGDLLWRDDPKKPGADSANDIVLSGQRVFVCGLGTNANGVTGLLVRAYNLTTGQVLWKSLADKGWGTSITANSSLGIVSVVGSAIVGTVPGGPDWALLYRSLVRTYNISSGALLWEDFTDRATRFGGETAAYTAGAGETLFVTGSTNYFDNGDTFPASDILIRAYDIK